MFHDHERGADAVSHGPRLGQAFNSSPHPTYSAVGHPITTH
jgi:hypothetical protein